LTGWKDSHFFKIKQQEKQPIVKELVMGKYISTKTKYVSTGGYRGYVEPINAVAGANDTGTWSDSPCNSNICEKEIKEYRTILRKNKIQSRTMSCQTSNIFCIHRYVLVHPDDRAKALELAKEHQENTKLFYAV
jgi:hypothetical protein